MPKASGSNWHRRGRAVPRHGADGAQILPVLSYIDDMKDYRTGTSRQQAGLDPDSLKPDRTAAEVRITSSAIKQRVKLIARIFAETLVKPVFQGILKLLTEGDMEPLAFRLRGEFVKYDPSEWRDQYDMTINVGLGTGDKEQQSSFLHALAQMQMGIAQSPYGQLMITPQNIYNTLAKLVEVGGQKNVGDFFTDPQGKPLPPSPPPPQIMIEQTKMQQQGQMKQMELQHQAQIEQMKAQFKMQSDEADRQTQAQLELLRQQAQQQTDANRQEMEARMHQLKMQNETEKNAMQAQFDDYRHQREMEFKRWEKELDVSTRIEVANISSKSKLNNPATETATAEIASEVQQ